MKEAIHCYVTAVRLMPKFAAVHSNLGSVLKEQGKLVSSPPPPPLHRLFSTFVGDFCVCLLLTVFFACWLVCLRLFAFQSVVELGLVVTRVFSSLFVCSFVGFIYFVSVFLLWLLDRVAGCLRAWLSERFLTVGLT